MAVVFSYVMTMPDTFTTGQFVLPILVGVLTKPTAAYFFMTLMSVGMSVGGHGSDPGMYFVEYFVVIFAAIAVGVFGGFALVRPVPHPSLAESVKTVWDATGRVIETLRDNGDRPVMLTDAFTEQSAAVKELRSERAGGAASGAAGGAAGGSASGSAGGSADEQLRADVERFASMCTDLVLCTVDDALSGRGNLDRMLDALNKEPLDAAVATNAAADAATEDPATIEEGTFKLITHARQLGATLSFQ